MCIISLHFKDCYNSYRHDNNILSITYKHKCIIFFNQFIFIFLINLYIFFSFFMIFIYLLFLFDNQKHWKAAETEAKTCFNKKYLIKRKRLHFKVYRAMYLFKENILSHTVYLLTMAKL